MGRLPIGVKALEHIEQYALIIVHLVHDMMYCCNFTNIFHSIFSSKKTDSLSKQKNILFLPAIHHICDQMFRSYSHLHSPHIMLRQEHLLGKTV